MATIGKRTIDKADDESKVLKEILDSLGSLPIGRVTCVDRPAAEGAKDFRKPRMILITASFRSEADS